MRYSTVSCDANVYCAFPDVARTASGRLVCAYREDNSHSAERSDDGET